ncbi:class I SAM-dependent methyltransferase [Alphaproteobacteria bacterium]|nr:class I SAM-dependent methyltransferase [Alphaproteobacteria bacterium]
MTNSIEKYTGELFGGLWQNLTDEQFRSSVELFTNRAIENKFDLSWIKGKSCLDAGCGSGRYSVALSMHNAKTIQAIDISKSGIEEAKIRCKKFENISFLNCSLLNLPFKDEKYDFVWSAGVIHHTTDFEKALSELTRVLKIDGKIFLLVYGAGGLRWKIIKSLRPIISDLGQSFLSKAIDDAGFPENNKKHFMDDFFVPIQTLTRYDDLKSKLKDLGYQNIKRWVGKTYDHEENVEAQYKDIEKIEKIFRSCVRNSNNHEEKYLSNLSLKITKSYLDCFRKITEDTNSNKDIIDHLILGEKNIRVVAEKK